MAHRRDRHSDAVVPVRGAQVQSRNLLWVFIPQVRPEDVREQVVVPVPPTLVVQRYEEQVRPLQSLQHRPAAGALERGVAEVALERVEHRGPREEVAHVVGLPRQHLVDEVVDHMPVVTGERGDEPADVVAPLQRQGGELQGRGPSLGACLEGRHVVWCHYELADVGQVRRRLVDREAQVLGADLHKLAASA